MTAEEVEQRMMEFHTQRGYITGHCPNARIGILMDYNYRVTPGKDDTGTLDVPFRVVARATREEHCEFVRFVWGDVEHPTQTETLHGYWRVVAAD
jgi:hypothetical protein